MTLYRKYRPQKFDDVIGQDNIIKTLKNQIEYGKVAHAYIFTGSRGTGKTTVAKIFAKAVNCENLSNAPCYKCELCKKMDKSAYVDIIELDGASNNKVDEMRAIKENIKFLPYSARKKVYIIDEAHMLTDSAFNAILKTLEEPPEHIIFILATTEINKIPATILSRCIRFDFKLVDINIITNLLIKIYNKEKIKYDLNAVKYIAALGEGSVRDALSIADAVMSACSYVNLETVKNLSGAIDSKNVLNLIKAIKFDDKKQIFQIINDIYMCGKNMRALVREVVAECRDMYMFKCTNGEIMKATYDNSYNLKDYIDYFDNSFLLALMNEFLKLDSLLVHSNNERLIIEVAALTFFDNYNKGMAQYEQSLELNNINIKKDTAKEEIISKNMENNFINKNNEIKNNNLAKDIEKNTNIIYEEKFFGKLLTELRENNLNNIYDILVDCNIKLDNNNLIIIINEKNETILDKEILSRILFFSQKIIPTLEKIKIKKKKKIDVEKELSKIKEQIGDTPLEIRK